MGAPYMPLYVNELLADTQGLSLEAFGAWMKTLALMWREERHEVTERNIRVWSRRWGCEAHHDVEEIVDDLATVATVTRHDDGSISIRSDRVAEELDKLNRSREKSRRYKARQRQDTAGLPDGHREDTDPNTTPTPGGHDLSLSDLSDSEEDVSLSWPVAMYRERHGRKPHAKWIEAMTEQVTDREVWAMTLDYWVESGYKTGNVAGLLESYARNTGAMNGRTGRPMTHKEMVAYCGKHNTTTDAFEQVPGTTPPKWRLR